MALSELPIPKSTKEIYRRAYLMAERKLKPKEMLRMELELPWPLEHPSASTLRSWRSREKWDDVRESPEWIQRRLEEGAIAVDVEVDREASIFCALHQNIEGHPTGAYHPSAEPQPPLVEQYAQRAPQWVSNIMRASMDDPDQLSANRDLGICDARIVQLLARIETGESTTTWLELKDECEDLKSAIRRKDDRAILVSVQMIIRLVETAYERERNWRSIDHWIKLRQNLTKAETLRREAATRYMGIQEMRKTANDKVRAIVKLVNQYGQPELIQRVGQWIQDDCPTI